MDDERQERGPARYSSRHRRHFGRGALVLPPSHPPRRPCPPDALTPTPPSQARGDNRAGRDGQRHIVLLEVQHRLHLAADEPVVHPRVRRAVQGTPHPPPESPPASPSPSPPLPLPAIAGRGHRTSAQGCCASCLWPGRSHRTRWSARICRRPSAPPISVSSARREPPARPPTRGRSNILPAYTVIFPSDIGPTWRVAFVPHAASR